MFRNRHKAASEHKDGEVVEEVVDEPEQQETDEQTESDTAVPLEKKWEEAAKAAQQEHKEKFGKVKDFFRGYWRRKKWTLPVTVLVLVIIILAVPFTRYKVLGLFIKHSYTLSVLDSTTGKPVSGATVSLGNQKFNTDAEGRADVHVAVGPHRLDISKKYYKSTTTNVTVPLFGGATSRVKLVATGRQVPISVINKITGQALAGVEISVLDTNTKTGKDGQATIVLPTKQEMQKATFTLAGYNDTTGNIEVTDHIITENIFKMTPVGKLYFLSNQTGKIDVVKTNLDGSDRETILAGTGSEDPNNTALLASRDWKYLALLSQRDGTQSVYLIDTSDDKVTNIDGGSATTSFTLVGWSGDTFVYQVGHSNIQSWQSGAQVLKSYDANAGKLYVIDQTQGEGTGQYDYGFTNFSSVYILNNELVYAKNWYASGSVPNHLDGKSVSLISVKPDGSAKNSIKDFPIPSGTQYNYSINLSPYEPQGVYVQLPGTPNTYYEYEDGSLQLRADVTDATFGQPYPTFLLSPSGKQTLWSDQRDGKNAIFTGDANAKNEKQIATLSEYKPYGWYSDTYILLSKNSSELYIMPASGDGQPLKITDYYKPPLNFNGYGGGYGGL